MADCAAINLDAVLGIRDGVALPGYEVAGDGGRQAGADDSDAVLLVVGNRTIADGEGPCRGILVISIDSHAMLVAVERGFAYRIDGQRIRRSAGVIISQTQESIVAVAFSMAVDG